MVERKLRRRRVKKKNIPSRLPKIAAVDSDNSLGIERKENIDCLEL